MSFFIDSVKHYDNTSAKLKWNEANETSEQQNHPHSQCVWNRKITSIHLNQYVSERRGTENETYKKRGRRIKYSWAKQTDLSSIWFSFFFFYQCPVSCSHLFLLCCFVWCCLGAHFVHFFFCYNAHFVSNLSNFFFLLLLGFFRWLKMCLRAV